MVMTTPFATVVVPVKNMSGRMENISSWLEQVKDSSTEIIFVNDDSTDSTFAELTDLKQYFSSLNIQVVSGAFCGPGGARNAGLSLAKGEWVVFWDSDDTPHPKTFFEMIKVATNKELDFAVGNWVECPNSNFKPVALKIVTHGNNLKDLIEYPGIWRWAFKRVAIGDARFPQISLGEDLIFLSKLQIKLSRVYRCRELVYSYSTGGESQLTSDNSIRRNSAALFRYLKSRDFFYGKITFFGALLKTKLLVSTIKRIVLP